MSKLSLQDEIRRITNETASLAAQKALEVAEQAKSKAAEVSTLAIAEALKAATLAATRAAEAASAAATIAATSSKDLEYIKKDIADTKSDIKAINEKLDNKYSTKEEFRGNKDAIERNELRISVLEKANNEDIGRGRIQDPMMTELLSEMKRVRDSQTLSAGNNGGIRAMGAWIFAGVMALITIGGTLFSAFNS